MSRRHGPRDRPHRAVASLAWGLAGITLLISCAPRRPALPPLESDGPGLLEASRPPLAPFRASLHGRLRGKGKRARFRAGLGALPPDFRLDLFHPVSGATLFSLGVEGGRLRAVWTDARECLESEATPGLMGRFLGLEVAPGEFLPLISGHVFPMENTSVISRRRRPAAPADLQIEVVSAAGSTYWAELAADRDGLAVRGRRVDPGGGEIAVEYPGWSPASAQGQGHPTSIRLRMPARKLRLYLEVREWSAGGPDRAALLPAFPPGCHPVAVAELQPGDLPRALFGRGRR